MMDLTRPSEAADRMKKVSNRNQTQHEATLAEMKDALFHPESLKLELDSENENGGED